MDAQKRWEIVSKDFGESLAYEGLATTDDIRAGLKKYLSAMFDKGVSSNNMHFVISSGAQKEPKTVTISNELKKMGYVVNNVTADQEAKYALRATVPPSFTDNSFLVDIGSGNTKISWDDGGTLKALNCPAQSIMKKAHRMTKCVQPSKNTSCEYHTWRQAECGFYSRRRAIYFSQANP